ncbi:hypothetical protein Tco_1336712 [Tanacetum coccineum]
MENINKRALYLERADSEQQIYIENSNREKSRITDYRGVALSSAVEGTVIFNAVDGPDSGAVTRIGSEGFHQVIDFLSQSYISYALTKKPEIYISFIKQFWRTIEASTDTDGDGTISAIN